MNVNHLNFNTLNYACLSEEIFSSKKHCILALSVSLVAGTILPICFPATIVLLGIGTWFFGSALIIELNQITIGSYLERPIHKLYAMAMEVNSVMIATALFPLTLLDYYHTAQGNSLGRPILMINGYLSFGSTWHYQREKLSQAGLGPIYTMNIGSGKSIKTYATYVRDKIANIQKETGRKDLVLIGHSKGGLVSSYYATHLAREQEANITDLITIGSPLSGTPLAYLGPGIDAYEMRSDSLFHQELREDIKKHTNIRFFHIASESDEIVSPSSALLREDNSKELLLKDLGHLSLLFSSKVSDQITNWLTCN